MKRSLPISIFVAALVLLLGIPAFRRVMARPAMTPSEHPNYHQAVDDLHHARKQLETAEDDGYGHRDKAMHAIDHALEECEAARASLH